MPAHKDFRVKGARGALNKDHDHVGASSNCNGEDPPYARRKKFASSESTSVAEIRRLKTKLRGRVVRKNPVISPSPTALSRGCSTGNRSTIESLEELLNQRSTGGLGRAGSKPSPNALSGSSTRGSSTVSVPQPPLKYPASLESWLCEERAGPRSLLPSPSDLGR